MNDNFDDFIAHAEGRGFETALVHAFIRPRRQGVDRLGKEWVVPEQPERVAYLARREQGFLLVAGSIDDVRLNDALAYYRFRLGPALVAVNDKFRRGAHAQLTAGERQIFELSKLARKGSGGYGFDGAGRPYFDQFEHVRSIRELDTFVDEKAAVAAHGGGVVGAFASPWPSPLDLRQLAPLLTVAGELSHDGPRAEYQARRDALERERLAMLPDWLRDMMGEGAPEPAASPAPRSVAAFDRQARP